MKNNTFFERICLGVLVFSFMLTLPSAKASETIHKHGMVMRSGASTSDKNTIKAEILIKSPLVRNKQTLTELELNLIKDNKPLLPSSIKETHTEKIHLLIFDQTLTDYQHIHPSPTNKPGIYQFEWTPKEASQYRVWVDLTPLNTGHQEYIMTNLGDLSKSFSQVDKALNSTYSVGERGNKIHFSLSFDSQELISGKSAMGKVIVKIHKVILLLN